MADIHYIVVLVALQVLMCYGMPNECLNTTDTQSTAKCFDQFIKPNSEAMNLYPDASNLEPQAQLISDTLPSFCSSSSAKTAVKDFFECKWKRDVLCTPEMGKMMLPKADANEKLIEFVCKNKDDFDLPCASMAKHRMEAYKCIQERSEGRTIPTTKKGFVDYSCASFKDGIECHKKAFSVCKKKTSELYASTMNFVKPTPCGASAPVPGSSGHATPSILLVVTTLIILFSAIRR